MAEKRKAVVDDDIDQLHVYKVYKKSNGCDLVSNTVADDTTAQDNRIGLVLATDDTTAQDRGFETASATVADGTTPCGPCRKRLKKTPAVSLKRATNIAIRPKASFSSAMKKIQTTLLELQGMIFEAQVILRTLDMMSRGISAEEPAFDSDRNHSGLTVDNSLVVDIAMFLTVRDVFCDGYIKCVSKYFADDIYHTNEFVKTVYDSPDHRNAFVRRLYIFADGHDFRNEDVRELLIKYGVVILPLFVPTCCSRYGDNRTMSDLMLTMYSPVLVGLWKRAVAYIEKCAAATSCEEVQPFAPVEIYVQKDCPTLEDFRLRLSDRLYHLYDTQNRRMFVHVSDSVVVNIARMGRRR